MSTEHQQQHDRFAGRAGRSAEEHQQGANGQLARKYFLGVAIDEYPHWPNLRNAKRDVEFISMLLQKSYGFLEKDIILLKDRHATKEGIINTLHSIVRAIGKNDSLIVYYAGHGHFDNDTRQGYWVPVDAQKGNVAEYVPNAVIQDYLMRLPSQHTILLSDSRLSDNLFEKDYKRDVLLTARELLQQESCWAICSGRHNVILADGPVDGHSPFAEIILNVLGKSDKEYITLDFLLEQVKNRLSSTYNQLPEGGPLRQANRLKGQFVFMRQPTRWLGDAQAWTKIASMPEQTLNQVVDKISTTEYFCDIFPNSRRYSKASSLIAKLGERREYLSISHATTAVALQQFLEQFPNSVYAAEVRKRVDGMRGGQLLPIQEYNSSIVNDRERSEVWGRWRKWGKRMAMVATGCILVTLIGYVIYNLVGGGLAESGITASKSDQEFSTNRDETTPNDDAGQQKSSPESFSGTIYTDDIAGTFVLVEGGSFNMGCTSEQQNCNSNEKPVHRVTLNSYYIGQYEVTQAQWREVMGKNPSKFSDCDQCPVEMVSWEDVHEFLWRLNARSGLNYRLPTEAEWEFAARGGSRSRGYQYAGSNNTTDVAWFTSNSGSKTHPVGQKSPNELGLYDMSGNVWEWCQDQYDAYSSFARSNPTEPLTGSVRVNRGGSWLSFPHFCRVALRSYGGSSLRRNGLGFRLAISSYSPDSNSTGMSDTIPVTTNIESMASTFILVEGGSFDMGCTSEQQHCGSDERPVHGVTLSSYYMGKYEVTQAQWREVMGNNPSNFSGCDQCPVEQVSWQDVQEFLRRLNERTDQNYRLPTEAEWEFAARGGNKSRRYQYAGSNNIEDVAWYNRNSGDKTHPVGQKSPNELGLYDMSGNVYEWCQDWYGTYLSSAQSNPGGSLTGSYRVLRGGSWYRDPEDCRVANRYSDVSGYRFSLVGFRLARTP